MGASAPTCCYVEVRLIYKYNLETNEWEFIDGSDYNFSRTTYRRIKQDGTGYKNTTASGIYHHDAIMNG